MSSELDPIYDLDELATLVDVAFVTAGNVRVFEAIGKEPPGRRSQNVIADMEAMPDSRLVAAPVNDARLRARERRGAELLATVLVRVPDTHRIEAGDTEGRYLHRGVSGYATAWAVWRT